MMEKYIISNSFFEKNNYSMWKLTLGYDIIEEKERHAHYVC
jgi:hypothetical protein